MDWGEKKKPIMYSSTSRKEQLSINNNKYSLTSIIGKPIYSHPRGQKKKITITKKILPSSDSCLCTKSVGERPCTLCFGDAIQVRESIYFCQMETTQYKYTLNLSVFREGI